MNVFIRRSLLHSVAAPLNVHVKNCQHGGNFKTVQDTQTCSEPLPLPRNRCAFMEAARGKADQLCFSQSSSKKLQAREKANSLPTSRSRAEETTGEAAVRREEDQRQTAAATDSMRLDPVDDMCDFNNICRHIRPVH